MNIYLITRTDHCRKYDIYDSAVVIAEDEEQARHVNPHSGKIVLDHDFDILSGVWVDSVTNVKAELIGYVATQLYGMRVVEKPYQAGTVICSSFIGG